MRDSENGNALRETWNTIRASWKSIGVDLDQLLDQCATSEIRHLESRGAHIDFDELCHGGCDRRVLACLLFVFRQRRTLEVFWIFGGARKHDAVARLLIRAATTFEGAIVRHSPLAPPLERAAFTLRLHARTVGLAQQLAHATQARSLDQLLLYLLSSYVHRLTKKWQDRNVSALIAAIRGDNYTPEAHKEWRSRNYERLDGRSHGLTSFVVALGTLGSTA